MKNLFPEEMSMKEFKDLMKNLKKKTDHNPMMVCLAFVAAIAAIALIVLAIVKFINRDNYTSDEDWDLDDERCDENGCYYTDDDDFEEDNE